MKLIVTEADQIKCESCFQESLVETDFGTWKHCDFQGVGACCDCGAVQDFEQIQCFECMEYFKPEHSLQKACQHCNAYWEANGRE